MVTRKSFNVKFTAKDRVFYVTIVDADNESLSLKSLNTFLISISICTTCMLVEFEQNRMVRTTQNFELLTKSG